MRPVLRSLPVVLLTLVVRTTVGQVPCENGSAGPYGCHAVDLYSVMSPAQLGVTGSSPSVNDCWGWTDPQTQREYALVGCRNGSAFVDITDPVAPVLVGTLPSHTSNSIWRDIKVYADHAFVVSEAPGHGLQVFDLTRLRNVPSPPVVFSEDAHFGSFGNAHNLAIDEQAGMAYAVGSDQCWGGLFIIDITDPVVPTLAGCHALDGYIHDTQCVTYAGPDPDHQGARICINSHSGNPDKKTIVDVTDASDVQHLSSINWPDARIGHQGWLTEDHRYFLLGDEGDELFHGFNTRTLVFDVSDLDAPVLIGSHFGTKASTDHNLYVRDGFVFQANYSSGLQVLRPVDLDQAQLEEVAWFDTYPAGSSAGYDGAWSVYPWFPSGNVIVSDYDNGLFVLRPNVRVSVKVCLGGAYEQGTGLMRDDLRQAGLVPLQEPYTGIGMVLPGGGGESIDAAVLLTQGSEAVVDWVVVELRDVQDPSIVLAARAALLQRDGDVVDVDGASPVRFPLPPHAYRIAVRHRNHLGAMTAAAVEVGLLGTTIDLTDPNLALAGQDATDVQGGVRLLWSGNAVNDDRLKYTGSDNDRDQVLHAIGGVVPTATVSGYHPEDVNLDGTVKYTGASNDRDRILQQIGGVLPTAIRVEQLP